MDILEAEVVKLFRSNILACVCTHSPLNYLPIII